MSETTCAVEGCDKPRRSPSVPQCAMHRSRLNKYGTTSIPDRSCMKCGQLAPPRCKYCEPCKADREREVRRESNRRNNVARPARVCIRCGASDAHNPRSKYCGRCRDVARSDAGIRAKLKRYNMTRDAYVQMLAEQDFRCRYCRVHIDDYMAKRGQWFAVDHLHSCCQPSGASCGKCVRALSCRSCNIALGLVGDDPLTLARMSHETWKFQRDEVSA